MIEILEVFHTVLHVHGKTYKNFIKVFNDIIGISFNSQALFTFFVNDKMECALTQQHKIENTYDHQFGLDVTILVVVCIVFF